MAELKLPNPNTLFSNDSAYYQFINEFDPEKEYPVDDFPYKKIFNNENKYEERKNSLDNYIDDEKTTPAEALLMRVNSSYKDSNGKKLKSASPYKNLFKGPKYSSPNGIAPLIETTEHPTDFDQESKLLGNRIIRQENRFLIGGHSISGESEKELSPENVSGYRFNNIGYDNLTFAKDDLIVAVETDFIEDSNYTLKPYSVYESGISYKGKYLYSTPGGYKIDFVVDMTRPRALINMDYSGVIPLEETKIFSSQGETILNSETPPSNALYRVRQGYESMSYSAILKEPSFAPSFDMIRPEEYQSFHPYEVNGGSGIFIQGDYAKPYHKIFVLGERRGGPLGADDRISYGSYFSIRTRNSRTYIDASTNKIINKGLIYKINLIQPSYYYNSGDNIENNHINYYCTKVSANSPFRERFDRNNFNWEKLFRTEHFSGNDTKSIYIDGSGGWKENNPNNNWQVKLVTGMETLQWAYDAEVYKNEKSPSLKFSTAGVAGEVFDNNWNCGVIVYNKLAIVMNNSVFLKNYGYYGGEKETTTLPRNTWKRGDGTYINANGIFSKNEEFSDYATHYNTIQAGATFLDIRSANHLNFNWKNSNGDWDPVSNQEENNLAHTVLLVKLKSSD